MNDETLKKINYRTYGCISSKNCDRCGFDIICDNLKCGTKDKDNKTVYVAGPCICGLYICPNCNEYISQNIEKYFKEMKQIIFTNADWKLSYVEDL